MISVNVSYLFKANTSWIQKDLLKGKNSDKQRRGRFEINETWTTQITASKYHRQNY